MRNTSGFKSAAFLLTALAAFAGAGHAADDMLQAVVENFEEKVTPIMSAAQQPELEPKKDKKKKKNGQFFNEITRERQEFSEKQQKRKVKFLNDIRNDSDMSEEKRQKKIAKYYSREVERKRKFSEKLNKKIIKNSQREN